MCDIKTQAGEQGDAATGAPPDVDSPAASGNGAAADARRGAFKSMNVFCNPLYSTA